MAWLDAEEASAANENASDWISENKVRTALAERLAGHPALLAQLNTRGLQKASKTRRATSWRPKSSSAAKHPIALTPPTLAVRHYPQKFTCVMFGAFS
ncbi:hypothetical protein CKO42_26135 [Lamprobacter modestohalophilus]|uniref:Uncharacterized protein n=1 Tax=Lamprobacter modestohalophilus TaxID=1064514 RepID=A0A9X1B7D9_9GAMM|nr:hypothetical protein [Lamprobacter modestohalophilus]